MPDCHSQTVTMSLHSQASAVAALLRSMGTVLPYLPCARRFDDIVGKMTPFLKQCGYNTKKGKGLVGRRCVSLTIKVSESGQRQFFFMPLDYPCILLLLRFLTDAPFLPTSGLDGLTVVCGVMQYCSVFLPTRRRNALLFPPVCLSQTSSSCPSRGSRA